MISMAVVASPVLTPTATPALRQAAQTLSMAAIAPLSTRSSKDCRYGKPSEPAHSREIGSAPQ